MRMLLITAKRVTPEGTAFNEEILVHKTALVPVSVDWFTAMIPAVNLVEGAMIPCQHSEDFLLVESISIVDESDYVPPYKRAGFDGSGKALTPY